MVKASVKKKGTFEVSRKGSRRILFGNSSPSALRLTGCKCDAKMHHIMAKATVRQLRYNFRAIEARLNRGEEIDLYKRKKMIGRLVPAKPQGDAYPDFEAISRK